MRGLVRRVIDSVKRYVSSRSNRSTPETVWGVDDNHQKSAGESRIAKKMRDQQQSRQNKPSQQNEKESASPKEAETPSEKVSEKELNRMQEALERKMARQEWQSEEKKTTSWTEQVRPSGKQINRPDPEGWER